MYIRQYLLETLKVSTIPNKVVIIYGPRQIGKTTLIHTFLKTEANYLLVSGEDLNVQHYLSSQSIDKLRSFVGQHRLLVIDEAQKIPTIGLNLKMLVDHCPGLRIVVTGSSAFDLAHQTGEPLTGRKITLRMFPLSQIELNGVENPTQTRAHLDERLIYGSYPEALLTQNTTDKKAYLRELTSSYLYKDIIELDGIRQSQKIIHLLQLLAFQLGKEVSMSEIAQQVSLNKITVERYLDLLEKCFILVSVGGFSRNLRKEISKKRRYYFYDTGIRNAIINHFNQLTLRNDVGALWENYIVIERLKKQAYHHVFSNNYYWRTYNQQEIDWVEERDGALYAYEIKWRAQGARIPSEWKKQYPETTFSTINQDDYLSFIT